MKKLLISLFSQKMKNQRSKVNLICILTIKTQTLLLIP